MSSKNLTLSNRISRTSFIDLGNTNCKFYCRVGSGELQRLMVPSCEVTSVVGCLADFCQQPQRVVAICSRNNPYKSQLCLVIQELWQLPIKFLTPGHPLLHAVDTIYVKEQLGVDRLLSLVAARHTLHKRCLVLDCGTCITMDLLDDNGTHCGGIIVPGYISLVRGLPNFLADHLREKVGKELRSSDLAPAICTSDAVTRGTISLLTRGVSELVQGLLPDTQTSVLWTGGDAKMIMGCLKPSPTWRFEEDLVVQGFYHLAYCFHQVDFATASTLHTSSISSV